MYVIDTNTLIYFFKGMGSVPSKFLEVSPKDIGIPSVVLYELEYGIAKSTSPRKRQAQLKELCSLVKILPFDNEAAKLSASVRAGLEKKGTPIGPHDVLIAGTALANKGILVTNNTKEFSRVPKLKLDNWYK
ncbi:MAG: type II toxin-antitoxin system VapC family toxin [Candidatus Thiodiazotropha taylori]|jgi:tRNA(fMet)-specific endonuclease VapC|nr:type II toxin-antitoxin system VapC family toxin [Candidatus Thiodiazotropha endolucinida]MCG7994113.1 type II toxin-antitoxin system VapC family toxin [Candidatus Thiodiazotropha taylori]RLW60449.1 MAG: VapC toxin family PIN domain ribonuclease [gamma proteobacterium symbiont of Stewartia floridana]MCG8072813.1 type II toxin-antitoxin system VapC family toxin [Candidatus Thiodiazotropha taylori]MCG8089620.1 type II toxin-antitoxin system VapC family toxin [Candidatus Thiodiazotropha taylori